MVLQNHTPETLAALRDFFLAQSRAELKQAYQQLPDAPAVSDWQALEFAFNRWFVGPQPPIAPPFASIYLEAEPQLMGRSTLTVRHIYELMALSLPWKNIIPDDHLGFELDAYRQMVIVTQQVEVGQLEALRQYFLRSHLEAWIPRFVKRAYTGPEMPAPLSFVIDSLLAWLNQEVAQISVPLTI